MQAWNEAIGWRWMFASGVVPSVLFLLLLLTTVPESPRWLVEQGRLDRARQVLTRIGGAGFADAELAGDRRHRCQGDPENDLESSPRKCGLCSSSASLWRSCSRSTGINVFLYYAPEIFKQVGFRHRCGAAGDSCRRRGQSDVHVDRHLDGGSPRPQTADDCRCGGHGHLRWLAMGAAIAVPIGGRLGRGLHPGLHRLFRAVGRARNLGDSLGDIPQQHSRPGDVDGHVCPVDGQLRRVADISHDGRRTPG